MDSNGRARPVSAAAILALALVGCGGSEGPGASQQPVAAGLTGCFVPAVEGLEYRTGAHSGLTDEGGCFRYESGDSIAFHVGALTLGTAPAQSQMTPVDLAADAHALTGAIPARYTNLSRLLWMLDQNGNSKDRIQISAGVRSRAAQWPQSIDFDTEGFETAVATLQADAVSVDGTPHPLPDSQEATDLLQAVFRCGYVGIYAGVASGKSVNVGVTLLSPDARLYVQGVPTGYDNRGAGGFFFTGDTPLALAKPPGYGFSYVALDTQTNAASVRFQTPEEFDGDWSQTDLTGQFTGGRMLGTKVAGSPRALRRYATALGGRTQGFLLLEVMPGNVVSGTVTNLEGRNAVTLTGSVSGTRINASSGRYSFAGEFDADTLQLRGTLSDTREGDVSLGNQLPWYGCQL